MTSRLVVNNIENDTGVTTVRLNPTYQAFELDSAERMRIDSNGRVLIGTTTEGHASADDLTIATSGHTGLTLRSGTSNNGNIYFSCATSGGDEYNGSITYKHSDNTLRFATNENERLHIDSSGRLGIGGVTPKVWHSNNKGVIQGDGGYSIIARSDDLLNIGQNFYFDSSDAGKYIANGEASVYQQSNGEHSFWTAASGSADASCSQLERLRITSGGGVKFMNADSPTSTTTPAQWLNHTGGMQLYGSSDSSTHRNIIFCSASNAASERMRIKSDGSVGIGTNSPDVDNRPGLHLYTTHSDSCRLNFETPTKPNSRIGYFGLNRFGMDVCNGFEIRDAADSFATRFMISSNGTSLFNTTSTTISNGNWGSSIQNGRIKTAHNVGSANVVFSVVGSSSGDGFRVMGDGDCENNNNSYTGTSDERLKQDIVDAASQWNDIKAVKVKKYRFKSNPSGPLHIGVIAQDLQSVSPGLVKEVVPDDDRPDEKVKTVKYSILYMKAIKALQEAMARIETLETKVAALESS